MPTSFFLFLIGSDQKTKRCMLYMIRLPNGKKEALHHASFLLKYIHNALFGVWIRYPKSYMIFDTIIYDSDTIIYDSSCMFYLFCDMSYLIFFRYLIIYDLSYTIIYDSDTTKSLYFHLVFQFPSQFSISSTIFVSKIS